MATRVRRGRARVARALVSASHPAPTAVVTALSVGLVVGLGAAPGTVALVALAVLAGQLSVGWSNDWLDAGRDRAVGRSDKPVATGALPDRLVRDAALAAAGACAAASWATGLLPGTLHVVAVASAWAYNLGLKRTRASVVPYALSFGLLPAFLALAAGRTPPSALVATGALLGAGAHVANVLPDLADDAATGVRGLPHRLGRRASSLLAPVLLAAGVVVVVVGLPESTAATLAAGVVAVVLAVVAGALGLARPTSRAPFGLSMGVAVVCVGLLVTAGSRLG